MLKKSYLIFFILILTFFPIYLVIGQNFENQILIRITNINISQSNQDFPFQTFYDVGINIEIWNPQYFTVGYETSECGFQFSYDLFDFEGKDLGGSLIQLCTGSETIKLEPGIKSYYFSRPLSFFKSDHSFENAIFNIKVNEGINSNISVYSYDAYLKISGNSREVNLSPFPEEWGRKFYGYNEFTPLPRSFPVDISTIDTENPTHNNPVVVLLIITLGLLSILGLSYLIIYKMKAFSKVSLLKVGHFDQNYSSKAKIIKESSNQYKLCPKCSLNCFQTDVFCSNCGSQIP